MVVYDDSGNRLRDQDQSWSGGLIVTDDTVTKQVFGYDSVDKAYTLEGQDGLRMHAWGPQEPVSTFVRWERVHDPIPGGLDGRWQAVGQDNYYTDEGDLLTVVTWQMTISLGERFEFHEQTTFQQGENEDRYDLTMVGEWQVDADEQFIHVDITSAIILSNGNTNTSVAPSLYEGQRLRFGYAAVALPNTLALSTFDSEQVYNLDTQVWEAVTEPSSGEYSRWLERH